LGPLQRGDKTEIGAGGLGILTNSFAQDEA
jgi:hypothetical protein